MGPSADLTVLLDEWTRGDAGALDRLTSLVYPDLHSIASNQLRHGYTPGLLQTTALVNELFVKLLAHTPRKLESRAHFFALCARLIRHALVDSCRESAAVKRGGVQQRVPLHDELVWVDARSPDMIAFDQAMTELEALDKQQADLLGIRFLLGCTAEEAAEMTGLSKATVDRKVRMARIWLFQRLKNSGESFPAGFTDI